MNTSVMEVEIPVTEESEEQILRMPAGFRISGSHVRLHRDSVNGPVTLSESPSKITKEERAEAVRDIFRMFDEAFAAGETFEIERDFCPPREVEV